MRHRCVTAVIAVVLSLGLTGCSWFNQTHLCPESIPNKNGGTIPVEAFDGETGTRVDPEKAGFGQEVECATDIDDDDVSDEHRVEQEEQRLNGEDD